MIIMKADATQEQIEHVLKEIKKLSTYKAPVITRPINNGFINKTKNFRTFFFKHIFTSINNDGIRVI